MPPKTVVRKSAKSEEENKKKDPIKGSKKGAEEAAIAGSTDLGSISTDNASLSKLTGGAHQQQIGGSTQLSTGADESHSKEPGASTSDFGQQAAGSRDGGDSGANAGDGHTGTTPVEADIKYEEPILPNLIVISYEGGKEKGLYEGYGKATYIGGHNYSGEWSGGMMNGRGRYEWADGVVYTGSIVNNQLEGVGTYQWPDGSTYQGDVLRGRRHGNGIFRHGQNPLIYDGEWNMGNMHGKGTLQFDRDGQSYYTGDFILNVPFGKGRRQYGTGNLYEGMWVEGKRHGYGVFSWSNGNGEYMGQWVNGVQNGQGTHIWYIIRAEESQYALRNYYEGNFANGRRDGHGTFYYSSGTRYTGEWKADQKHGKGKVILRNGTTIEADFFHDRITTRLTTEMTSMLQLELPEIISKTPIPSASNALDPMNLTRSESRNTMGPSFKLQLDDAFNRLSSTSVVDEKKKITDQIFNVLLRHLPQLKQIYRVYARLGVDLQANVDNTFLMIRMQFWRFVLDCKLHSYDVTPMEYDRMIAECLPTTDMHGPNESFLVREFLNAIAIMSFYLFRLKKIQPESTPNINEQPISLQIAATMETIIEKNILQHAGSIKGNIFVDSRKYQQASRYTDQCYKVYLLFCTKNQDEPYDLTMNKRDFLLMLRHLQIIDPIHLTAARVISILAEDDPNVRPEGAKSSADVRLDIEMCFLEFFEALVGCALIHPGSTYFNTHVKRPHTETSERSLGSQPSLSSPVAHERQESRASEYPTAVVREVSELTQESHDENDKPSTRPRSLTSRERETTAVAFETSSISSWTSKVDDFLSGIFLPAATSLQHIQEVIRVDEEKTWQGSQKSNINNSVDAPWPVQYAVLTQ